MTFENSLDYVKHQIKEISNRIDLEESDLIKIANVLEDYADYIFVMTPELAEDYGDDDDDVVLGKKYISHFRIGFGTLCSKENFEDSRLESLSKARKSHDFDDIKEYLVEEFLYQNL